MKKLMDREFSMADLKNVLTDFQDKKDKKCYYVFIGVLVTLIVAAIAGIAWLVKKNLDQQQEQEWDEGWDEGWDDNYDWDDEDKDTCDECCCTDKDVDTSVKVEKL